MIRLIIPLLLGFLLSGCAIIFPDQKEPISQEQQLGQQGQDLFIRSVAEFLATGNTDSLQQFLAGYPDNDQAASAQALITSALEYEQCRKERERLNSSVKTQLEVNAELEEKNQQLRETIEQLKTLLIQLEKRSN